jgi:hypothetical protein
MTSVKKKIIPTNKNIKDGKTKNVQNIIEMSIEKLGLDFKDPNLTKQKSDNVSIFIFYFRSA